MRLRVAVLTALTGAALAVPVAPAAAAACTSGSGVTVVVDFASLSGGTQTRCASGDPTSGVAALRGAGFTPTRAAQEPGYFLCRIDGKPANDPCQRTSPADAYWSYWHAKPCGSWTYSSIGPADYDPAPGTVEGWAFGAGKPPSSPPPRPTQPSARPTPSTPTATTSPAAPSAVPSPRGPTAATQPAPVRSAPAMAVARTPSLIPSTAPPETPPVSASSAGGEDRRIVSTTRTLRFERIPWSVVAGLVLVLLLVAAAVRQVAQRRRESGG